MWIFPCSRVSDDLNEKNISSCLVDLEEYKHNLLRQKKRGLRLTPVRPVPSIVGHEFTRADKKRIAENHAQAQKIYNQIIRMNE